jgi:hypothetical protein
VIVPLLQEFLACSERDVAERLREFYASRLSVIPRPEFPGAMHGLRGFFSGRYPKSAELQESDIADASLIDEIGRR